MMDLLIECFAVGVMILFVVILTPVVLPILLIGAAGVAAIRLLERFNEWMEAKQ